MSLKTLNKKAFRVSIQWNALVRKPLSLERGGFTIVFNHRINIHALKGFRVGF